MVGSVASLIIAALFAAFVVDRVLDRWVFNEDRQLPSSAAVLLLPVLVLGSVLLAVIVGLTVTGESWSILVAGPLLAAPVVVRWFHSARAG